MIRISFDERRAVFTSRHDFADNHIVKKAGFWFDRDGSKCGRAKTWFTRDLAKAAELAAYADESCRAALAAEKAKADQAIAFSRAADADVDLPVPAGLSYLGYQRAGIAFASQRRSTLFADEMGLGKTVQAIGVMNVALIERDRLRMAVFCPNSLKFNWRRELQKWLIKRHLIGVAQPGAPLPIRADVVIVNYDVVHKHQRSLMSVEWDVLVADECHLLKNENAHRTIALLGHRKSKDYPTAIEGIVHHAQRRLFLTGTPIVNRPSELFPMLHALDPLAWSSYWDFMKRYCGANGISFDTRGAANLDELQDRLRRTVMIRRLKKDVLTDLPPKRRQIIEIPDPDAEAAVRDEHAAMSAHEAAIEAARTAVELSKASDDPDDYKAAVARLRQASGVAFSEISKQRHKVALAKAPAVIAHLRDTFEGGVDKIVAFAWHRDVIEQIAHAFAGEVVTIHGDTPAEQRQDAVDRFQQDRTCRLFIGSITAAGVGLTLTASSHVVFAELDWVPANMSQAEDRTHRIGQRDSVLVQHIVLAGSLDASMAATLVEKQNIADKALDDPERLKLEPVTPMDGAGATLSASRKEIERVAATLTASQIAAIHTALRLLAGVCDGARAHDGAGFSAIDTRIGHALAEQPTLTPKEAALGARLLTQYRTQLPDDLLIAAGVIDVVAASEDRDAD